jgi:hypothetical protein
MKSFAFTLAAAVCTAMPLEQTHGIIMPRDFDCDSTPKPSGDNKVIKLYCDADKLSINGFSSASASVAIGDYSDATGFLPDKTKYSEQWSHESAITRTSGGEVTIGGGFDKAGASSTLSATIWSSVSIEDRSSNTIKIETTIDCQGRRGKIQIQPLYVVTHGEIRTIEFPAYKENIEKVDVAYPQTGSSGGQLANYRVICEE